jgi:large subunit ribosomal protein L31
MKPDTHPAYGPVVFRDNAGGFSFLTRSTLVSSIPPDRTVVWEDGRTYPVMEVDISVASHPFWTGTGRVLDTAGRVERFNQRYGRATSGSTTPKESS